MLVQANYRTVGSRTNVRRGRPSSAVARCQILPVGSCEGAAAAPRWGAADGSCVGAASKPQKGAATWSCGVPAGNLTFKIKFSGSCVRFEI